MAANDQFYVKFFAPVMADSIGALMQIVEGKLKQGYRRMNLLISCTGGDVFQGISAYNFLRGIPLELTTHNFGSADSMGVVLFCAGELRLSVPHARFLLHGATANFSRPMQLEEKQLEEKLKSMQIDMGNIARVIADTVGRDRDEVVLDMLNRTALFPEQAMEYGLVHEIRSELFGEGAEVYSIQMAAPGRPQGQPGSQPVVQPPPEQNKRG